MSATHKADSSIALSTAGALPSGLPRWISESLMRRALLNNEFVAFYQPLVNIKSGQPVGMEVLARWDQPVLGLISPEHFLPELESLGLLDELYGHMLEQALCLRTELLRQDIELNLSFNIHPVQLQRESFARDLGKVLRRHACAAQSITLEIIETGQIEPASTSFKNLLQLRLMGCSLSMDDFGSGFSSLQRLCELPFNEIKLDAAFLRHSSRNLKAYAVIESVSHLAWDMGMRLVVEGVENHAQLEQLQKMGCTLAQGYYFARPMPAAQLNDYYRQLGKPNAETNN